MEWFNSRGFALAGNHWTKDNARYTPVYEAKMFRPYDHRYGTVYVEATNRVNQGQTHETTLVEHQSPEFSAQPRYWVEGCLVDKILPPKTCGFIAFRDITRSTDTRTSIAAFLPPVGAVHTTSIAFSEQPILRTACLLSNLNAMVLDFVAKLKLPGTHLSFFIVEQLPVLPPDRYDEPCPWAKGKTLEAWIAERVLKLTCTAEDMLPLADACSFTSGSFKAEYGGRLHKWNDRERAEMMAELDAAFFHLYGLDHDDAEYVLSTFKGIHEDNPLLPGHPSTAKFILELYDGFAMQSH